MDWPELCVLQMWKQSLVEVVSCLEPFVLGVALGIRVRPHGYNLLALFSFLFVKHVDLKSKLLSCLLFEHFFGFLKK